MFSATLPEEIVRMSAKYLKNPERVSMGATNVPIN
jgi:superfamily II DNA/RNA helicase